MKKKLFTISIIAATLLLYGLILIGCNSLMNAEMKLSSGSYDEAIVLYKEFLAEKPGNVKAISQLGFAYLKTCQLDEAEKQFKQALELKPGEPFSVLYLGMTYLNKNEFGKTVEIWSGYRNKKEPIVEDEIKRLTTVIQIKQSQIMAEKAIAEEKKLKTIKPDMETVAVCYFADMSPDKSLRAFQKGMVAMVITDLAKIKSLKVVERLQLQALFQEMKLGQTGIVDASTAPRVGHLLGAENIIVGNLIEGSIKMVASLSSTSGKKVKGTTSYTVEKEDFFELPKVLTLNMAEVMGIQVSDSEKQAIGIPETKNFEAFILFGQALEELDLGNWAKAKNLFREAYKLDPSFNRAKERSDDTPNSSMPTVEELKSLTPRDIIDLIEENVNTSVQSQKDKTSTETTPTGGGGGGGGGS
ncbi:tetratricopeptide repeat protein [bacterium]|nr:tetratricopeptide repeat protein [bacterium]